MSSIKHQLRVAGAVAALATLAVAVSCKGFFQNPTWSSISIQPSNPAVAVGFSETLQAWGTDTENNRSQITNGVVWSLSGASGAGTVATIDPSSGLFTGVATGSVTITAASEGISGTATGTVVLSNVTSITVTPTSASIALSASTPAFTFTANAADQHGNPIQVPITTDNGGVLTISPTTSDLTCAPSGNTEVCTGDGNEATGTYTVIMGYTGSNATATVTITVT
jgi:hypothetical protein